MGEELKLLLAKAKELLDSGKKGEYLEKLKEIYEDHKDPIVVYLLFVQYISRSNYETALKYLLILGRTNEYMNDYYTYMLLLSNFVSIPDDVKEKLSNLEVKDFELSYKDDRFENIKLNNLVRENIAKGDCYNAMDCHSAIRFIRAIQNKYQLQSQEYVIFCLLNEKVVKQPRRLLKAFKEGRYEDILNELKTITFPNAEEKIIIELIYVLYDVMDGAVINRTSEKSKNLYDAVYNHDYLGALNYAVVGNKLIELLLRKIVDLTNENIVEQYSGNLGTLFDDYCNRIYSAIVEKNYSLIKQLIQEYFKIITRQEFDDFIVYLVDYYETMGSGIEDIMSIMADLSYRKPFVDNGYLKKLFGDAIRAKNYKACEVLFKAFESLKDKDKKSIDNEYLKHVYNYQRYLSESIEYKRLSEDLAIYNSIRDIHDKIMITRIPEKIVASSEYEERVIRNAINSYNNLAYMKIVNEDGTISFYIKKQNIVAHCDRDGFINHAKFLLRTNNFECLKGLLLHAFTLVNRFDYTMLSFLAYAFEKLGEEENRLKIVEVLKVVCDIDDYHEIVENEELALVDPDFEYMYGIPNIELIINDIMNEGANIDEVLDKYKVDDKDIPYVMALVAREFYKIRKRELGDKYYHYAENQNVDDKEFRYLLSNIRSNKSYYRLNTNQTFVDYVKKLINKS